MKIAGRKTSGAYELYGFIPKVENGKHSAICMSCNRVLQNTAAIRLQKHRNSCLAVRSSGRDPGHFANIDIQRRIVAKTVAIQQDESNYSNVKTEQSNMAFEDENFNDNVNDNTTYEDTVESTNSTRRLYKTALNDEMKNVYSVPRKTKKELYYYSNQEENPIQSPVTTQQLPSEPFESYQSATSVTNTSADDVVDEIQEVNDEDLINIEEELDVIQNLMPRSKESKQLQDELSKAETEYYRCKAAYFTKLTENCKIKKTLMLLESRKLQLEIEKLSHEF